MPRSTARVLALLELLQSGDEAVAVLVGLIGGPRSAAGGSSNTAESATAKIRRVLPKPSVARLGALRDIAHVPGRSHPGSAAGSDVLLLVADAARERRLLEIVSARWPRPRGATWWR